MSYPTWQLMLGGVGTPKMQKMLIPVDAKLPFEQVMAVMHYVESKVAKLPASWWWCLRGLSFSATSRLRLPPFGQPRPISRLGRAGRPHSPCTLVLTLSRRSARTRGRAPQATGR